MKIAARLGLLAALGVLGCWLWTVWFPNPEKVVLGRVAKLAAVATVGSGDGAITRAAKVSDLLGFFSTDAVISYDVPGLGAHTLTGRDEIREIAAGGFANVKALTVRFQDATARVDADQLGAVVSCTARVSAGDAQDFGVQELRIQLRKLDGDWRVTRLETVRTLQ
jgi:hypothetical protein